MVEVGLEVGSKLKENAILDAMPVGDAHLWGRNEMKDFLKVLTGSLQEKKEQQKKNTQMQFYQSKEEEGAEVESGIVPKTRFRGTMCSLGAHGLLFFGGRGGGDGCAWWLWNLNWTTVFVENGNGVAQGGPSEGSSDWITSDTSGSGLDSGASDGGGGGNRRLDRSDSEGSEW